MEPEETISKNEIGFYKKLHKAKLNMGGILRDSTNPHFKSKYFDINKLLEEVEPVLLEAQLLIMQPVTDNVVTTKIIDIDTGFSMSSQITMSDVSSPQKLGLEISYYRRYSLTSMLSLRGEDDDGNASETLRNKKEVQKPKSEPTTNAKPTASDLAMEKLFKKIEDGEKDVLKKASETLDLRKKQINSLLDAQLLHDEETKQ